MKEVTYKFVNVLYSNIDFESSYNMLILFNLPKEILIFYAHKYTFLCMITNVVIASHNIMKRKLNYNFVLIHLNHTTLN